MDQEKYEKVATAAMSKGVALDSETKRLLKFFVKGYILYFSSTERGGMPPDKIKFVSERLGFSEERVLEIVNSLHGAGILEETRGLVVPGGREYWFGLKILSKNNFAASAAFIYKKKLHEMWRICHWAENSSTNVNPH